MTTALALPVDYGYVLLVASASTLLTLFHGRVTSRLRYAARVPYPNAFVTASEAASSPEKQRFNSAQKAHMQFNEHYTAFLVNLLIAGLSFPQTAAGMGLAWAVSRVMYAVGYARKENAENGRGRMIGGWWYGPHFGLMGMAFVSGYRFLGV